MPVSWVGRNALWPRLTSSLSRPRRWVSPCSRCVRAAHGDSQKDTFLDFLEVSIHQILYSRNLYPPSGPRRLGTAVTPDLSHRPFRAEAHVEHGRLAKSAQGAELLHQKHDPCLQARYRARAFQSAIPSPAFRSSGLTTPHRKKGHVKNIHIRIFESEAMEKVVENHVFSVGDLTGKASTRWATSGDDIPCHHG